MTVFLAQLDVYGYTLTAIAKTKKAAYQALEQSYLSVPLGERPKNDYGNPRSFHDYAEYAGLRINPMPLGHVEWL